MPYAFGQVFQFQKALHLTGSQPISLVEVIKERFSVPDHSWGLGDYPRTRVIKERFSVPDHSLGKQLMALQ